MTTADQTALDGMPDPAALRTAAPAARGPALDLFVPGRPAPQGSKHARPIYRGSGPDRQFTGRVAQVESSKSGVATWRADVRDAVTEAWRCPGCDTCRGPLAGAPHGRAPLEVAVALLVEFVMPRPASTPKTRTPYATKRPDVSKLLRSTEDAITTAGVWRDDSLAVEVRVSKRLAEIGEASGARIVITPLECL